MTATCSHCGRKMPPDPDGHEIAVQWTVVRIEVHNLKNIAISYMYLCPHCTIQTSSRQTTLPNTNHPTG
jgi:hypothetical protein